MTRSAKSETQKKDIKKETEREKRRLYGQGRLRERDRESLRERDRS